MNYSPLRYSGGKSNLLQRQKETLISEIQGLIDRVYKLDY